MGEQDDGLGLSLSLKCSENYPPPPVPSLQSPSLPPQQQPPVRFPLNLLPSFVPRHHVSNNLNHQKLSFIMNHAHLSEKMMDEGDSYSSQNEHDQEIEPQTNSNFSKSLQELKDLCSQLHAAAGYCESIFLNSNHKHLVVESTKEYVCKAVVAVVDHLGSVSSNLDQHILEAETNTISQTEGKIDYLTKKLFICQEYSDRLALAKMTWRMDSARYNPRYLKPPVSDVLTQNKNLRESGSEIVTNAENVKHGFKIDKEVPHLFYTRIYKSPSSLFGKSTSEKSAKTLDISSLSALQVRDKLYVQPKPQALSFQSQDKRKSKHGTLFRKSMTNNEILSIIRRSK